ncbi:amidohydrolase family protein [Parasphingorhabdus sp.]|uniref:amidohydrolase family protein n=1 Tax=Parasphingorhabdus sp. TaxID=2709688 RepID=UPI003A9374A4
MSGTEPAARRGGAPQIDCHAHIFTRDMPFAASAHSRPGYEYPVEAFLSDLAKHGLTHGVIAAASLFGDYNDYTLECLAAHPNLRATIILEPDTPLATIRAVSMKGVVGVRLVWRRLESLPDVRSDPWRSFFRHLAECGLHVELLAGGARLPELLPAILEQGVDVVLDHFGVPPQENGGDDAGTDAMLRAVAKGRTWVKLSAGFRIPAEVTARCTERLLAEGGPGRLLWGSDAPFINHEDTSDYPGALAYYHSLVPDPATRAMIDETARKLFFE